MLNVVEAITQLTKETPYSATIIVDNQGIIKFVSDTYLKFANISEEQLLGKNIAALPWDTKTLKVLSTGKTYYGYPWSINGRISGLASSFPVFDQDKLIGCFTHTIFLNTWGAEGLLKNLLSELDLYRDEVIGAYSANFYIDDIVGKTQVIQDIKQLIRVLANQVGISVLINGESGSGKELVANSIHNCSKRARMPFVRINCAAIPENLFETELFGYDEGSFTGAIKGGKPGKFELANHGTIFMDEIGELPLTMQSKLLIALQSQNIERVGGHKPIRVNARFIAATNKDLVKLVREGRFREDLFYRLNVMNISVPPLRNRIEDIPMLSKHLVAKLNQKLNLNITNISSDAMLLLSGYDWPGNVRELENILERALILADVNHDKIIKPEHIILPINPFKPKAFSSRAGLKELSKEFEKRIIEKALEQNNYNTTKTSSILKIDKSQLYRKIKEYQIPLS